MPGVWFSEPFRGDAIAPVDLYAEEPGSEIPVHLRPPCEIPSTSGTFNKHSVVGGKVSISEDGKTVRRVQPFNFQSVRIMGMKHYRPNHPGHIQQTVRIDSGKRIRLGIATKHSLHAPLYEFNCDTGHVTYGKRPGIPIYRLEPIAKPGVLITVRISYGTLFEIRYNGYSWGCCFTDFTQVGDQFLYVTVAMFDKNDQVTII